MSSPRQRPLQALIQKKIKLFSTIGAFLAVLVWSASPSLAHEITPLPLFERVGLSFLAAFLYAIPGLLLRKKRKLFLPPKKTSLLAGCILIVLNHLTYCISFQFLSPSQVELIYYLWPLFFTGMLIKAKVIEWSPSHILALSICLAGVAFSGYQEGYATDHSAAMYLLGIAFPFVSALAWASYNFYFKKNQEEAVPFQSSTFSGPACLITLFLHTQTENFVLPTNTQLFCILFMGIGVLGLSQALWLKGVSHGYLSLVSLLPYLVPILSILLLIFFGKSEPSLSLLLAGSCVSLGFLVLSVPKASLKSHLKNTFDKILQRSER